MDSLKPVAEVSIDPGLLQEMLAAQHPDLATEAVSPVDEGWDNATYRLGSKWAARLPRRAAAVQLLRNEQRWLDEVTAHLGVEIPRVERIGQPSELFPWPWSVVAWIDGSTADVSPLGRGQGDRLAGVLRALHRSAPDDAPDNPFRGVPLRARTELVDTRLAMLSASGRSVADGLGRLWAMGLAAPVAEERVWLHGDLHPRNVLVREGELVALIDWGDMSGGDPATDLAAAWTLLRSDSEREEFWRRYGWTEPLWLRARAWAVLFGTALSTSGEDKHEAIGRGILDQLAGDAAAAGDVGRRHVP